jgi:hypothetical protein
MPSSSSSRSSRRKTQSLKEKDKATLQRVLWENAQAERVLNKNMAPSTRPTNEPLARPTSPQATLFPSLEIEEYPDVDLGTLQGMPISNPDNASNSARPAANTRYQRKVCTITQDYLFHLMDSPFLPQQFTSKQASACKYPLKFICDFAYLVLDNKTGNQ